MSDQEDLYEMHRDDTRYSTPVPELDDHRNQSASVQRPLRSRRGTIDTLYGTQALNESEPELSWVNEALSRTNAVDFENAIDDGEEISPGQKPSRRPTASSTDSRGVSPPNSVKAFALARRREREPSVEPHKKVGKDDASINRTVSRNSRRSLASRRYTNDSDGASVPDSIHSSAAEDVCFPHTTTDNNRDKRKLYIDFDFLEKFIAEEERDHTPPKNQPAPRTAFRDLRSSSKTRKSGDSTSMFEKNAMDEILDEKLGKTATEHYDGNRFSFFSSAWESTIHAAEFGDLIMPGEDVRNLFYLPEDESDGVWWLNMNNPTEEEIRAICKAFQIHPLTMEDIEKQETREKIELFPAYYFACFRSFNIIPNDDNDDGIELEPFNVYVIVFREGTLSFSFAPNRHVGVVRKRITALKDYVALSSDWICYALM
jgi:magnesium transporter